MDQTETAADDWYKRANLALSRGKESLAREALSRRQPLVEKLKGLQQQYKMQETATDKLYTAMMELESKIKEAAVKKEQLVARARAAKTTQQVNDMVNGLVNTGGALKAFARMEEKVEALEAAAEVSAEMANIPPSSLEAEFALLEMSSSVDDELERMKKDLNLLSASTASDTAVAMSIGDVERVVEKSYL